MMTQTPMASVKKKKKIAIQKDRNFEASTSWREP
jgi:hypothetical protein